jgi:hypothetical protein
MTTRNQVAALLCLSLSIGLFAPMSAFAQDDASQQPNVFLAIPGAAAAAQSASLTQPKELVREYLRSQLVAHNLTPAQYLSLDPDLQRAIVAPGRTGLLTREIRRAINPVRRAVPPSVISQIAPDKTLSADLLARYAILVPDSVAVSIPNVSSSSKAIFIGDELLLINSTGRVEAALGKIF